MALHATLSSNKSLVIFHLSEQDEDFLCKLVFQLHQGVFIKESEVNED